MKSRISYLVGVTICSLLLACSGSEDLDNPRRGTITIASDESFKPLVHQLTNAYEGVYPDAHFEIDYKPEQLSVLQLLQDSARIIFSTRELSEKEKDMIKKQKSSLRQQYIAVDGLALVASKINSDSLITVSELEKIFDGSLTNWSQMPGSNQTGLITLVFDNINASNFNFVREKFKIKDISKLRIIATGSNEDVIRKVKENPLYLGFIGVNWISDGHSVMSEELSKGLNVFGVSKKAAPDSISDYLQPFQSGLQYKRYPLSRDVYIISREGYSGLGGGLMTYIARDVGGLIIEKMGLLPVVPYVREIEIKTGKSF